MKNIQSLIVLLILTVLTPTPSSFADSNDHSNWKTYGFTEIPPFFPGPFPQEVTASATDDSFSVYIATLPIGRSSGAYFAANNTLNLNENFDIRVNYHQSPETYKHLFMAIGLTITNPDLPDFNSYFYSAPSSPTHSSDGSLRILYDSKIDKITSWQSSLDSNNKLVTVETGSAENFRKGENQPLTNDKKAELFFSYGNSYNVFEDNLNPIQDRNAGFSDLKVTAAPEPITTTLFLVGGGLMGLSKLRRKKA